MFFANILSSMSYCLNPACRNPQNPPQARFCQSCKARLLLAKRYLALKPIGQGGFGRTFLAVDQSKAAKSCCLIKQFLPKNQGTDYRGQAVALFRQEALRLKELGQHPQIPDFLDYFEHQSPPNQEGAISQYLVQEFIDGQTFAQKLAEEGTFNEAAIRRSLNQLLPLLQFIHDHQVIHRDIKPENIISPAGTLRVGEACPQDLRPSNNCPVVLVDFGAAKLATATALYRTGTLIGTAGFTAPEQLMGKAVFASDLYSLGVTCAHLLTQIPPFDLFDVNENTWVWRDYLTHPVSQSLGHMVDKLLQSNPKHRYQSAADVLQDLNPKPLQVTVRSSVTATVASPAEPDSPWQCLYTLTEHSATANSVAINPQESIFASGSDDQTIHLWHLDTGKRLRTFSGPAAVKSVAISPDGEMLAGGSDHPSILLWSLDTGELLHTLTGHSGDIRSVTFSPDGTLLISGSGDDTLKLWYPETGECLHTIDVHSKGANSFTRSPCAISSVAFHPHDQLLASSSDDKTIKLWNLHTLKPVNTLIGHTDEVTSIAISPDGTLLASGSLDHTINLWNLNSGELLCTLTGHHRGIHSVAISTDGNTLVSGSLDDTINLWSLKTRELLHTLAEHTRRVYDVAISADGNTLISSSGDRTIKIWRKGVWPLLTQNVTGI
jgi:WD40 repeat protein